jgi:PAS domain S-box-containing protein
MESKYGIPTSQIEEISNLLVEYSMGNYHYTGKVSEQFDEIDTIIEAVNMLGQELNSTTVSRDYFMSIFNASQDYFFIINSEGIMTNGNTSVTRLFGENAKFLDLNINILDVIKSDEVLTLADLINNDRARNSEVRLNHDKLSIPVELRVSPIYDRYEELNGYFVIAQDITERKNTQRLILRKTFEAQQAEQKRVSQDLHDSIGQELSALSLMVSNLKQFISKEEKATKLYQTCQEILKDSISQLREISFNLMPSALDKSGIIITVEQLVSKLQKQNRIKFNFVKSGEEIDLDSQFSQAIYRIIQEFINNSLKHSGAKSVLIEIHFKKDKIIILAQDDGRGFDVNAQTSGSGLNNYYSRVNAFGGKMNLQSALNEGTRLTVEFEINTSEKRNENIISG